MPWPDILTFVFVASLLVMSPGPNGVLIAKTVPTSGRTAGLCNIAGFVAAFYLHGTLSILGISIILVQSATAFMIVKYLGAAYLCWIGITALWGAWTDQETTKCISLSGRPRTLRGAFVEGFLTNALNPKVSLFYLAAFPQFITPVETSVSASFLLVFLHSMVNAVWFSAMVILLTRLTIVARHRRFQRWLKCVTGVVFVGFGVKLARYQTPV